MVKRTSARFHGSSRNRSVSFFPDDDSIETCTFYRAGDSAKVTYISDAIENQKKRFTALFIALVNDVFKRSILYNRQKTNHALMVFGRNAVELLLWNEGEGYFVCLRCIDQLANQIVVEPRLNIYFLYLAPRLDGFHHSASTKHHFLFI